jgi:predicted phage terminase large subunit-like protein
LISQLERIVSGDVTRLMVLFPPGYAKSTYSSVLFPTYWFCRHPKSAVIAASHTSELAESFGRRVRNLVTANADTLGYTLRADSKAAGRWETDQGGEYYAIGIDGSVTGRRADLIVIDDPVKDRVEAYNEKRRETIWDQYRTALYTRLKPDGCIVLIMTRWHELDLAGRLLDEMGSGGDDWTVLSLPAIAEDPALSTPEHPVPPDPLGRLPGEPLWPEWESLEGLARKRRIAGELDWSALFQQRPKPPEGLLFDVKRIGVHEGPVSIAKVTRAWDLAATEQVGSSDPDWTVGMRLVETADGRYVITDVKRMRGPPEEVRSLLRDTAWEDGDACPVMLPEDPGQAGKAQTLELTKLLAGYKVRSTRATGSKATRAGPVISQVNVGNLYTVNAPWRRGLLAELRDFPNGRKDDQVDALSEAFNALTDSRSRMKISDTALTRFGVIQGGGGGIRAPVGGGFRSFRVR